MKKILSKNFVNFIFLSLIISCNYNNKEKLIESNKPPIIIQKVEDEYFTQNKDSILKDYKTWYSYHYYNVKLSEDFIAEDIDTSMIKKADFLKKLSSGDFVALKISKKNGTNTYRLCELKSNNQGISSTIKQLVIHEISNFEMEGRELPLYSFTDVNGNIFDKQNTKGKYLVLKCWFIGCVSCVAEFPQLNKFVEKYKERKDILFISLAMDPKDKLVSFLTTKPFNYSVVPNMKEYMIEKMGINQFPTHIIVDKDGKIMKLVNTAEELISFVKNKIP